MHAVSHVKSNTIGDFTGTVTVFGSNGSTQTANATDLVRPADWNSAHLAAGTISGNTAGQSTFTGTNVVLAGGNNVTLSVSTAASAATVSIVGPSDVTHSTLFLPDPDMITNLSAHVNATMSIQHRKMDHNVSATAVQFPLNISSVATSANNSSGGFNASITMVVYTKSGDTLNSVSSTTWSNFASWSSNATASVTGAVVMTAPWNVNLTEGNYYFGANLSTLSTGGGLTGANTTALNATVSIMGMATQNFGAFSYHPLGSGSSNSSGWLPGQGLYSGTSNLSAISVSAITHPGTNAQRANFALKLVG